MVIATNLGFPRIGARRELKKATESYWKGDTSQADLLATGKELRLRHWKLQQDIGLTMVPTGDFSYYDQVLDMTATLGAVPERYQWQGGNVDLDTYFAMARGNKIAPAMEMTKWFDTNYHYIVPELTEGMNFRLSCTKYVDEFLEAKEAGITARPVLIGPLTYLKLSKQKGDWNRLSLLDSLLGVYLELLGKLKAAGATWVQLDEPALVLDLDDDYKAAYEKAYTTLARAGLNVMVATYFGDLGRNLGVAAALPVQALHIDLRRGEGQLESVLAKIGDDKILSLGLIDGRNIWRNNLRKSLDCVAKATQKLGKDRVWVAPSCSMLHSPIDLDLETRMDPQLKTWLAFGTQKLIELVILAKGANEGENAITSALTDSDNAAKDRASSPRIHNPVVQMRMKTLTTSMFDRKHKFAERQKIQRATLGLPSFPTTTIGSFPQTPAIREARAAFKKGDLPPAAYEAAMKQEIDTVVKFQEDTGIDVLVHGEPERNDMVEYFGEQLAGYAFSQNGWVQSYGSRYVKPPIIFGDVSRPQPMTVAWSSYAQSLTKRPMKGMLTGPITMLFWSFVRDDQPKAATCYQIALALRDEVVDLQNAGIRVIQIDEPAIREGLPLRKADWDAYLKWAVESFRLTAAGVDDATQIHTHMCYSDFNDIIDSIGALDADAISIETSRSQMELLEAFATYKYPNEIGPGVYDIHSPRIPTVGEMTALLEKAAKVIDPDLLWVNPDCGLKTRGWAEVKPALENMVKAAQAARSAIRIEKSA